MPRDRSNGNEHKLEHVKLQLDIRNKKSSQHGWSHTETGCAERLWHLHPKLNQTSAYATCCKLVLLCEKIPSRWHSVIAAKLHYCTVLRREVMGLQQYVSIFKHVAFMWMYKNEAWPCKKSVISTRKVESYSQQLSGDMQFSLLFIIPPPKKSFR